MEWIRADKEPPPCADMVLIALESGRVVLTLYQPEHREYVVDRGYTYSAIEGPMRVVAWAKYPSPIEIIKEWRKDRRHD